MITIKIEQENIKKRLDVFLVDYFENKYPRARLAQAIEKELFLINNSKFMLLANIIKTSLMRLNQ